MFIYLIFFLHFFISLKYDFHNDAERMIVKAREILYPRSITTDILE